MKKNALLAHLLLATPLFWSLPSHVLAQDVATPAPSLHVIKSNVNAEADNAELCLEFDKPLAPVATAKPQSFLQLEADGKVVVPQNVDVSSSSLCVFPLDRSKSYHISVSGLHGTHDERMTSAYHLSFTVPDRSPSLAFTGKNGGVNGFGSYEDPLTLRAVNVARAKISVYRVSDPISMAHAWQDREQTSLAPTESAYLARTKGQQVWENDDAFEAAPNATLEQRLSLREKIPALLPGLYLIVADANETTAKPDTNSGADKQASKGLAPLAAAWFTKSDFSIKALRDEEGVHVFATDLEKLSAKSGLHLLALNKRPEQLSESQIGWDGVGLIPPPPNLAKPDDITTVIGLDPSGNVGFADISGPPALLHLPALGSISLNDLFALPGDTIDLSLTLASPENANGTKATSVLRLSHPKGAYADVAVPSLVSANAKLSLAAPVLEGAWNMRWQSNEGTVFADAPLRVTKNADAPRFEVSSSRDALASDAPWNVTIKSLTSADKPQPLAGGKISIAWQRQDPGTAGWKDYQFGTPTAILDASVTVADFLTDLDGQTQLRLSLPARPQDPGLYQAVLSTLPEADTGIAPAAPLVLPLRPDSTIVGIKPMAADARFAQNGIARFALIGLSSDGSPKDISGISYQVYEEGRSFAWYQDEGRWKYKPEPQLRPIGGGPFTIKGDASSILEWPVTAGNYRLVVLDGAGKTLAQTTFSAGWDSNGPAPTLSTPLNVTLPKVLKPGHEVQAHVQLTQNAMLTAIVADTRVRKIVHEMRNKGDNIIAFTPGTDWHNGVSLTVETTPQGGQLGQHGMTEAIIAQEITPNTDASASVSVIAADSPASILLHSGETATLTFGVENKGPNSETLHYSFVTSAGLKIEGGGSGSITLEGKQSRSLPLSVSGDEAGVKEIRLDVDAPNLPHSTHTWNLAVLAKTNFMHSVETTLVAPQQAIVAQDMLKPHVTSTGPAEPTVALVSRHSMEGLPELLAFLFNIHPFTTNELALSIDALRLWSDTIAQTGFAPDLLVSARRQEWITQLLKRQNSDGGFSSTRTGESTMEDTSVALTALGHDTSSFVAPARSLAIAWIKQRLSNTWFDEKERASRANAYAALAAADALDATNLHYFSDTSANTELPALSEANIAAAFKQIRDPNAAAFWIKKMLDANTGKKPIELLNALAATDALSSDDVHEAMTDMTQLISKGTAPSIADVAGLLRAVASDNADAAAWKIVSGTQTRSVSGVLATHLSDPLTASIHSADAQPLSVTFVGEAERAPSAQPAGASVTRHVYRLNGVELAPQSKPLRGETYMVEITGTAPDVNTGQRVLIHDGSSSALRPIGCPMSPKIDAPAFIPWFVPKSLSSVAECELDSHELNAILEPIEGPLQTFDLVYFAHIDAQSVGTIAPPRLRIIK